MEFEWDEAKADANLAKHGIDFVDAMLAFEGPMLVQTSPRSGEPRKVGLGICHGLIVAIVFVERGGRVRLISARRARTYEREAWHDRFAQGS